MRRERPLITWRRTISEELKKVGTAWVKEERLAKDGVAWRDLVEASCASEGIKRRRRRVKV